MPRRLPKDSLCEFGREVASFCDRYGLTLKAISIACGTNPSVFRGVYLGERSGYELKSKVRDYMQSYAAMSDRISLKSNAKRRR